MALFPRPNFNDDLFFEPAFSRRNPFSPSGFQVSPFGFSNDNYRPYNSSDLEVVSDNNDAFVVELSVSGYK